MGDQGIIIREGDQFLPSEEELNQHNPELKYHFSNNQNIPLEFGEVSNVLYENTISELRIEYGRNYKHKCTGILANKKKDKKFSKHGVRFIDLTRVTGEWYINTNDIKFDNETLCKIGDVERRGSKFRILQCFPT